MSEGAHLTPMFRQYRAIKQDQPQSILLFRMGDFYEMFFEDAKVASRILELTLTARGKGTDNVVPMCGFPHHQLDAYTARLVQANQKVAICDQVEDPKKAKGLVKREVVRVVTPGTANDPAHLDSKANVWIASCATAHGRLGAAFLDATTGEFLAWDTDGDDPDPWSALAERLQNFAPREIVLPEGFAWNEEFPAGAMLDAVRTEAEPYAFSVATAAGTLTKRFDVGSMDGFGFRDHPAALAAAAGLLQYVEDTQRRRLDHIDTVLYHEPARAMLLDAATRRNLEIERCLRDGGRKGSLFHAIDATLTPGGGRLLRRRLLAPLIDAEAIERRLDAVAELHERSDWREDVREQLKGIHDIERLLARAVAGTANARDLLSLGTSLGRIPGLVHTLADARAENIRTALDGLDPCDDLAARIGGAIVDQPPATVREGGVIRDGHDAELDELRTIRKDGRAYLASLEAGERESTGISSLKVRFNKVFGYFIEVSKSNLHLVPDHYQRKQTIANGERYITPVLKEYEAKILQAQERIEDIEQELFRKLRAEVAGHAQRIKGVARVTAELDVIVALAEIATREGYRRPTIVQGRGLKIVGGRHPVVEQTLTDRRFVPNDTELEPGSRAIAVLTGPNMGGKSTYLRQVALVALIAQAGSFVPAESAEIGIVDRVFCRVGASDSLSEGQSTFMVEMAETANILHHATSRSLLLLDEIGRGTSTFDGLSIAWAVVEHLHAIPGGAPRCLFATHYHELTELAVELESVTNLRMAVREHGSDVVFLHVVEQGASDRSYGIHVARLAGVPNAVVQRAEEILANIERDEFGGDGQPRRARRGTGGQRNRAQASLFEIDGPVVDRQERSAEDAAAAAAAAGVLEEIRGQVPDRLTPLDALNLVADWVARVRDASDD